MIYIMRHGQTEWNLVGKTQGSIETELNEVGISQAEAAREKLSNVKIDVVLCSPRKRARKTAEIICQGKNIPIIDVENLKERGFGEFEGKQKGKDYSWEEFWDWKLNKQYEKAECVRDFYNRVVSVIEMIKKDYANKNVLIVTHSGICAMLYCYVNNIEPSGRLGKLPGTQNCEIVEYDIN